jgi:release factor glutamine methyltransferase
LNRGTDDPLHEGAQPATASGMTLHERIAAARRQLVRAGLPADAAAIDAEVLARHVLGWDRAQLFSRHRDAAPAGFDERYQPLLDRRSRREPVAMITGTREFWGRDFTVTSDTLVPRPETELIVEEALRVLPEGPATIIDIGTGTGCLAVTLAAERPQALVAATDISHQALLVARANAARHQVHERIHFVQTDLASGLGVRADVIVSNPPYVPQWDADNLATDVVSYEPAEALFSGSDGMTAIGRLLATVAPLLAPGGIFIVEFGYGQEDPVREAASREGWRVVRMRGDLQEIPRTAVLERNRE